MRPRFLVIVGALISLGLVVYTIRQRVAPEVSVTPPVAASAGGGVSRPNAGLHPAMPSKASEASPSAEIIRQTTEITASTPAGERLRLVDALVKLGPGAESELGAALRHSASLPARTVFADALARLGSSESVDQLLGAINAASSEEARRQMVRSFDSIPPGQPLETLVSSLVTAQDPMVRDAVVATVGRAADANTVHFLGELFHEPVAVPGQTEAVLAALASIHNSEATGSLVALLRDSRELPLMESAARALAKIGTPDSLQGIADSFDVQGETNPGFRDLLLRTLQAVDNPEARSWLEAMSGRASSDPALAKAAAVALTGLKSKS